MAWPTLSPTTPTLSSTEFPLLLGGDQVSVPVQPHGAEAAAGRERSRRFAARGSRPSSWLPRVLSGAGWWAKLAQLVALLVPPVDEFDAGVCSQLR